MANVIAPNFVYIPRTQDIQIEGGNPIIVHGMVFSGDVARETVDLYEGDGSTLISTFRSLAAGFEVMDHLFVADKGLKTEVTTDTDIIIFYEVSG